MEPASTLPKREVTRTGVIHTAEATFGSEERFQWQKPRHICDVMYDTPSGMASKSVIFGTASRTGLGADIVDPEAKKRNNGPGSYEIGRCYDFNSEYINKKGFRFGGASRQSMAMKTPSPGAVYNIDGKFYMGPNTFKGISFGHDVRKPLATPATSADAEMLIPKLPPITKITIGKRLPEKKPNRDVPGAIYDVHKRVNFKTGPSFSFSKGPHDRFKTFSYLSELD